MTKALKTKWMHAVLGLNRARIWKPIPCPWISCCSTNTLLFFSCTLRQFDEDWISQCTELSKLHFFWRPGSNHAYWPTYSHSWIHPPLTNRSAAPLLLATSHPPPRLEWAPRPHPLSAPTPVARSPQKCLGWVPGWPRTASGKWRVQHSCNDCKFGPMHSSYMEHKCCLSLPVLCNTHPLRENPYAVSW